MVYTSPQGLRPACLLIALIGFVVLTAVPGGACCYDPPDEDSPSEQTAAPSSETAAAPPSAGGQAAALGMSAPSEAAEEGSSGVPAPRFVMISQMMAEGRYLRARQLAEARLKTRPYDHHLWQLLEQIYKKLGLQGRTANAAYQARIAAPGWRPPAPSPLPPSAQKGYVTKLLQAVREFKPID